MNRILLVFFGLFLSVQTNAQLLNEIGFFVGGSNYSGDIGNELYVFPNRIAGGLIYKRNLNSRFSARASYSYLPIADKDANSFNSVRKDRDYSFSNTLQELAVGIEFNYFDYDVMSVYNGFSPYIFVEFATFHYNIATSATDDTISYGGKIAYAIPFGLGYKSKITDTLGYSLELNVRYTFEDDLDYNNKEIDNLGFGNPNTNDWYFFTGVSLTYSFGRPPCFSPR